MSNGGSGRKICSPVQVYLDSEQREMLERLATFLGVTRSEVMRRSLEELARDPRLAADGFDMVASATNRSRVQDENCSR
jgi:hypothetical protein